MLREDRAGMFNFMKDMSIEQLGMMLLVLLNQALYLFSRLFAII